ncbi:MAG: hypothetical protein FWE62_02810 [Firmicutes bacterium]|nr:hypothetical protein [Bacillota bacterium]
MPARFKITPTPKEMEKIKRNGARSLETRFKRGPTRRMTCGRGYCDRRNRNIFQRGSRYLLVLALFTLIGFCVFFSYAFRAHEDALVKEKAFEKQQDIGMIAGIIDLLAEMDRARSAEHLYEDVLIFTVKYIEENFYSTFAQVYTDDLTPLLRQSPGIGGGSRHDPLDYPEFIDAVNDAKYSDSPFGELSYWYETPQAGGRNVHIVYRWMPTNPQGSSRYLIVIGISRFTIQEQIDTQVIYGAAALVLVTAVYIIACTVKIVRLGAGGGEGIQARRKQGHREDGGDDVQG